MAIEKITIPDFGDVQKITVVELFIAPGDKIEEEASLIALESEKAVMDIPSPFSGVIKEVLVKEDDVVGSGDVIALIETEEAVAETTEGQPEESAAGAEVAPKPDEKAVTATHDKVAGEITAAVAAVAVSEQVSDRSSMQPLQCGPLPENSRLI